MSDYILPHPDKPRRAKLLSPLSLLTYSLFVLTLFFSTRTLALHLPGILGFASDIKVEDLVNLVNQKRSENGASGVRLDPTLCEAARKKGEDMFAKGYWAHVAPDGTQPWAFFAQVGYDYIYAGENLAKDFQTSGAVVEAWMNSPSHRQNLVSPKYDEMGLAVVNGSLNGYETTLVVQEFGRRKSSQSLATITPQAQAATTPETPPPAPASAPTPTPIPTPTPQPTPEPEVKTPSFAKVTEGKEMKEQAAVPEKPSETKLPAGPEKQTTPAVVSKPTNSQTERVVSVPKINVFTASKTISLLLAGFLAGLFFLDFAFVTVRGSRPRLSGHTLAHLGLLVLSMLGIWYVNAGVVL